MPIARAEYKEKDAQIANSNGLLYLPICKFVIKIIVAFGQWFRDNVRQSRLQTFLEINFEGRAMQQCGWVAWILNDNDIIIVSEKNLDNWNWCRAISGWNVACYTARRIKLHKIKRSFSNDSCGTKWQKWWQRTHNEHIHIIRMGRSRIVAPKDTPKLSDRKILILLRACDLQHCCESIIFRRRLNLSGARREATHQNR